MSRPQDLPAVLKGFGSGNYPAGSHTWSGQPQRLLPSAALVPGSTLAMPVVNALSGNALDAAQAVINLAGEIPALNWGSASAIGSTPADLAWSDFNQCWFAPSGAGASANIPYSLDFGKTWLTQAMAASITALDLAVDAAGNIVVMATAGSWQVGTGAASYATNPTWASYSAFVSLTSGSIAYDALASTYQWFALGANASGNVVCYASATRTAWVGPALPSTWSSSTVGKSAVIGASGTGVFVAAFVDTTTSFRTMVRNSSGSFTNDAQWTVPTIATNYPGSLSRPLWSPVDGLWYLLVNFSQLWTSPDGISWSLTHTFSPTQPSVYVLTCIGALLVALDSGGGILASWNKGVNWWRCGRIVNSMGSIPVLRAGGNGLLAAVGTNSYASQRFGLPVTAI